MRGAVRYGSAEKAGLYSLPVYIFGKTGTATELNGFRTHGWFIGFASRPADNTASDSEAAPEKISLAVLVFLTRGHGFEAAQVARPIFDEFARASSRQQSDEETRASEEGVTISETRGNGNPGNGQDFSEPPRPRSSPSIVRVHMVRENITRAVAFEDYVRGVVAAEGSMETEPEALKALAVAVRVGRLLGMRDEEIQAFLQT